MRRVISHFVYIALCVGMSWLAFQELFLGVNTRTITATTTTGILVTLVVAIPIFLVGAGILAWIALRHPPRDYGATLAIACLLSGFLCIGSWNAVVGLYNDRFGTAYQIRSTTTEVNAGQRMSKNSITPYSIYTTTIHFDDQPLCGEHLRFTNKNPSRFGIDTTGPTIAEITRSWLGTTLHHVRPATDADKPGHC